MQTNTITPKIGQQCRVRLDGAKSLTSFKLNSQKHATTCNRMCKRTQHVTSNIVWRCWPSMLRPFARDFILLTSRNTKQEIKNKKMPQFFVAATPFFIAITFTMYFIHTNNYKALIRCAFHVFPVSHFLEVLNSVTLSLCSNRYFSIAVDSCKIKFLADSLTSLFTTFGDSY